VLRSGTLFDAYVGVMLLRFDLRSSSFRFAGNAEYDGDANGSSLYARLDCYRAVYDAGGDAHFKNQSEDLGAHWDFNRCVVGCSMAQFTSDTSTTMILIPLILRGISAAFLFIPINQMVLGEFSGVELGQVSGMQNFFRQIGGRIGIASLDTLNHAL